MAKEAFKRGTTSKMIRVFIRDTSQTDGRGLAGLVYNTSGLVAAYTRQGDSSATVITLATATAGTWTSGGFVAVDPTNFPGLYEVGLPNAAVSSGQAVQAILHGATNMAVTVAENQLEGPDNQDGVRYGLSALPNVVAGANGGLPTGDGAGHVTLTTAEHIAISGTDVETALTTQGLTTARAAKLDDLDAAISSRLAATADPTTALTEIAGDTDTLITNVALQATAAALGTAQTAITEIATDTDSLLTGQALQATASALTTAQTGITEIAGDTDTLLTNLATVNGTVVAVPAAVWTVLTSTLTAAGSVGAYLLANLNAAITSRLASGAVELDLTQAIPVSPRPGIGTVGEALAAGRAYAIGNESSAGNAVLLHASDDSTVFATDTYSPSISAPTSRTRS
jgi:hypothetical protein